MSICLKLKNIMKKFGNTLVLDNLNFTLNTKEVISVIGPSGSGKTTLLRLISGLEKPDSGKIEFSNKNINIGIVFQDFNLWPHKTVLENIIEAPLLVHKIPKDKAVQEALLLLEKVNLSNKVYSYPSQLSGGEKQRVAIARALIMKPQILLFDEITSNLDLEMIGEVNKIIKMLVDEGFTLVFVSHDIFFVSEVSDKILFLDKGKIVESGSASEILWNPKKERTRLFLSKIMNRYSL